MSQSPEVDESVITSRVLAALDHGGAVCLQDLTDERAVCPSAIVPVYLTTRCVGCMSLWYHVTTRWWGSPPRGPPGEWAVCHSGTM
jgi:hypothetical protein